MNDKSQFEIHSEKLGKGKDLSCKVIQTEKGYQAQCPTCPWTSEEKINKGSVELLYDRHLEYIGIPLL